MENIITEYFKITGKADPGAYLGPEEQAKQITKCSILKDVSLEYSNFTGRVQSDSKR